MLGGLIPATFQQGNWSFSHPLLLEGHRPLQLFSCLVKGSVPTMAQQSQHKLCPSPLWRKMFLLSSYLFSSWFVFLFGFVGVVFFFLALCGISLRIVDFYQLWLWGVIHHFLRLEYQKALQDQISSLPLSFSEFPLYSLLSTFFLASGSFASCNIFKTGNNFIKHIPEDIVIVHMSYESQSFQLAFKFPERPHMVY